MSITVQAVASRGGRVHVTAYWWPQGGQLAARHLLREGQLLMPPGHFTRAQALQLIGEWLARGDVQEPHGRAATSAGGDWRQPQLPGLLGP